MVLSLKQQLTNIMFYGLIFNTKFNAVPILNNYHVVVYNNKSK